MAPVDPADRPAETARAVTPEQANSINQVYTMVYSTLICR